MNRFAFLSHKNIIVVTFVGKNKNELNLRKYIGKLTLETVVFLFFLTFWEP